MRVVRSRRPWRDRYAPLCSPRRRQTTLKCHPTGPRWRSPRRWPTRRTAERSRRRSRWKVCAPQSPDCASPPSGQGTPSPEARPPRQHPRPAKRETPARTGRPTRRHPRKGSRFFWSPPRLTASARLAAVPRLFPLRARRCGPRRRCRTPRTAMTCFHRVRSRSRPSQPPSRPLRRVVPSARRACFCGSSRRQPSCRWAPWWARSGRTPPSPTQSRCRQRG
mmetsp:Transcript_334/g.1314  ORF Transcript_334/g.1314 Transcript_334/m.1314 type:complete len:221 (-) Transcript_334:1764-2426(-)